MDDGSRTAASHSVATAASSASSVAATQDDTGKMYWQDLSAVAGTSRRPTSAAKASTASARVLAILPGKPSSTVSSSRGECFWEVPSYLSHASPLCATAMRRACSSIDIDRPSPFAAVSSLRSLAFPSSSVAADVDKVIFFPVPWSSPSARCTSRTAASSQPNLHATRRPGPRIGPAASFASIIVRFRVGFDRGINALEGKNKKTIRGCPSSVERSSALRRCSIIYHSWLRERRRPTPHRPSPPCTRLVHPRGSDRQAVAGLAPDPPYVRLGDVQQRRIRRMSKRVFAGVADA